jgi:thiol-disulfide isomerase/thioredoxin
VGTTFIRFRSIAADFGISFLLFFLMVYILSGKVPGKAYKVPVTAIVTLALLTALAWVLDGAPPIMGCFDLAGQALACVFGYLYRRYTAVAFRIAIVAISVTMSVFYYLRGHDLWVNYLNYGTATGIVHETAPTDWMSQIAPSADKTNYKATDMVVLDFFNTRCGYCFADFPTVQQYYEQWKNNDRVAVYALDIPIKGDTTGMAMQLVRDRGYTFPVLVGNENLKKLFNIQAYPTVIVLQGNHIIFRGTIEDAGKLVAEKMQ